MAASNPAGQAEDVVRLSAGDTQSAVEALRSEGAVVLEDLVSQATLARLRRRMDVDTVDLLRFVNSRGGNPRARGHLQQGPPPFADYVFGEIVMNEVIAELCLKALGADSYLSFYNGNTNTCDSEVQHLHMDTSHLSGPGEPVLPMHSLVVNIAPQDCTLANGAVELWLGSHALTPEQRGNAVPPSREAQRRVQRPPIQALTRCGDVLVRDMRLWHRGVPNPSRDARHMIAIVVTSGRVTANAPLMFGRGCDTALEGGPLRSNARYTNGPIDYLFGPSRAMFKHRARMAAAAAGSS